MRLVSYRAVVALLICAGPSARAQGSGADVEAEMLFREGKALLKAGKVGEACDKFDASERRAHNLNTLAGSPG